jgi:hypothetical protein
MKKLTGSMVIEDLNLQVGEKFRVGRYTMVYAGDEGQRGSKWHTLIPVRVWNAKSLVPCGPFHASCNCDS